MAFLLDSHPEIISTGEIAPSLKAKRKRTNPGAILCTCGVAVQDCQFWGKVFKSVQEQGLSISADNWSNDYNYENKLLGRLFNDYSHRPWLRSFQRIASVRLPFHRERIIRTGKVNEAFIEAILTISKASVFFEASKCLMRLDNLVKINRFNVKVIRLVRDVRAYVNSAKSWGEPVAESALHWKRFQLVADQYLSTMPKENVLAFRYEDLCENPEKVLKDIWKFLNVSIIKPPNEISPEKHHILGNHMRLKGKFEIRLDEKWRKVLTEGELDEVMKIAGKVNEKWGYN
jgi:hypothetical protein